MIAKSFAIQCFLIIGLLLAALSSATTYAQDSAAAPSASKQKLQKDASAPISTTLEFLIENDFIARTYNQDGYSHQLVLEPLIPILIKDFPDIVIRPTFNALIRAPNGNVGVGDLTLLQLFMFPISGDWGHWGIGPSLLFPTATSRETGAGKWQAGATAAFVINKWPAWQIGLLLYNLTSFAGDGSRDDVNLLSGEPTLTYTFSNGWFVGIGGQTSTFNWKTMHSTLFTSVQGGKLFKIHDQPISVSVVPFYVPIHDGDTEHWGIQLNWTFLFPQKS